MKIAILNNAANYLYFNVNLAKYLQHFEHEVVFLNTDKFISRQLQKKHLKVVKYNNTNPIIHQYKEDSDLIVYYKRLNNIQDTTKLIQSKNIEFSACYHHLKQEQYDFILILNGAFNVETEACKSLSIKTFFFEHSYFPKAIQMDPDGVNSKASFADLMLEDIYKFSYSTGKYQPYDDFVFEDVNYNIYERYVYRMFDIKYNNFLKGFILRKHKSNQASKRFKSFSNETIDLKKGEKYILFPLQVNSDTQIILNSKYSSMYEAIDDILPELKASGMKIIIKEHPMEVEPVDYKKYADHQQVFVVSKIDLDHYVENAEFIVNINSSVGMQAVSKYKRVVLLGDSFYKNSPLSIYYPTLKSKNLIEEINNIVINKEETDKYIQHFKSNIFIDDHFYKPTVNLFERIRNRLV